MGIGFLELVVIALAALVLLGPQRLPEIMRQVAKFYVHIRRTSNDFKSAFDHVVQEAEVELKRSELSQLEASIKKRATELSKTSSVPIQAEQELGQENAPAPTNAPRPRLDEVPTWDQVQENGPGES
jgi:sec-independent protein translocase protein TatB